MTNQTLSTLTNATTKPPIQLIQAALDSIALALQQPNFDIGTELKAIHATLKDNPDVAFILTDEEIGKITQAYARETAIVLASPVAKKAATPKLNVSKLSIDDF